MALPRSQSISERIQSIWLIKLNRRPSDSAKRCRIGADDDEKRAFSRRPHVKDPDEYQEMCSGSLEITLDRPVDRQRYVKTPLMERGTPRNNVEKLNRLWKASGVKITNGLSIGFVSKRFLIETEQSHFPG